MLPSSSLRNSHESIRVNPSLSESIRVYTNDAPLLLLPAKLTSQSESIRVFPSLSESIRVNPSLYE